VSQQSAGTALPSLRMGDTVYTDYNTIISTLEELYVLSDIVQTVEGVLRRVRALREALLAYLLAPPGSDAATKKELIAELGRVEFRLKSRRDTGNGGGDYLEGDEITYGDMELAFTLAHLRAALPHFKGWNLPDSSEQLQRYTSTVLDMAVFKATVPSDAAIIARYEALGAVKSKK
jgi:glutathione dehydrogenase/transferase